MVASGAAEAQPFPPWMTARPGTRPQILPAQNGYAVLPFGAQGVACTQRLEVVAPDGTSCGSTEYRIADGTCDTNDLVLGEDGTVLQALPLSMEATTFGGLAHTCTWRFWPGALR